MSLSFKKILVATDFSEHSEAAVSQGLKLARLSDGEIVLLHVGVVPSFSDIESDLTPTASSEYHRFLNYQLGVDRDRLEELRQRISGQGPDVSHMVIDGHPDVAIPKAALEANADLVVVGTQGRSGLTRLALGSVAEGVVRRCETSVLVARPRGAHQPTYNKILVPVDFSEMTDHVVDAVLSLCREGVSVDLFHAWQLPSSTMGYYPPVEATADLLGQVSAAISESIERKGKRLITRFADSGATVEFVSAEAHPTKAILRRADTDDYDLVVVGSHGRRGLRRFLLGSVAERVVQSAPCSVLVARGGTTS